MKNLFFMALATAMLTSTSCSNASKEDVAGQHIMFFVLLVRYNCCVATVAWKLCKFLRKKRATLEKKPYICIKL